MEFEIDELLIILGWAKIAESEGVAAGPQYINGAMWESDVDEDELQKKIRTYLESVLK